MESAPTPRRIAPGAPGDAAGRPPFVWRLIVSLAGREGRFLHLTSARANLHQPFSEGRQGEKAKRKLIGKRS